MTGNRLSHRERHAAFERYRNYLSWAYADKGNLSENNDIVYPASKVECGRAQTGSCRNEFCTSAGICVAHVIGGVR